MNSARRLTFFIALLLPVISSAQNAVPEAIARIAGSYAGLAFNGNDLDPVVTVLAFDDQGRFAGTYRIDDERESFEGRLSGLAQEEGERQFSLEWTDRDGEGFLYLNFNADYSAFDGFWTNTEGQSQLPWNGRRQ